MSLTLEQIQSEAMKLTPQERADLADRLWISVASHEEVSAAWDAEIERRIRQIESGEVETFPHEVVMAELKAKLGQ
jgi:putative addiction module component (TIGR02574 family)